PTASAGAAVAATQAPTGQTAPTGGQISMSIATIASPQREWQRYWANQWAAKHPEVTLKVEQMVYNDAPKKQLAELATNTMQDVVYSGIKWFPYSAAKGAFRAIDDYVKANDPGMSDFFKTAISASSLDGKLFALPYLIHPGNNALVVFNKNLLDQKNVKVPTDDWTVKDYLDMAVTLTDKATKIFGMSYFPSTYYDFCSMARSWGGDDMSSDGRKFTFATDPKSVAAAQWVVDLRTKYHVAPSRADAQGLEFPAGRLATSTLGVNASLGEEKTVGNRFAWDVVLFPKGPTGVRGYQGFVEMFSVYSHTRQPEQAYDLVVTESSKETGIWAVLKNDYQPNARKSVWAAPDIKQVSPIFERVLNWMSTVDGPFPMPYNLRFSELEDKWENISQPVFYGEEAFGQGIQKVQEACQAIVDLPRP
ncbi:MAG: extracellular solute-binding protein, partial [Chloroflexota bacterium]